MTDNEEMQTDSEPNEQFAFSLPKVLPAPVRTINFGANSAHVFLPQQPQESTFIFAVPENPFETFPTFSDKLQENDGQYKPRITRDSFKPSINVFTKAIKDTTTFQELKKNTKSHVPKNRIENSLTCSNVPKSLLTKTAANKYFSTFGQVLKVTPRPKAQKITVYFAQHNDASKAYQRCGEFEGEKFQVEWTSSVVPQKSTTKKKEAVKKILTGDLDDEVQMELKAMQEMEKNLYGQEHQKEVQVPFVLKINKAKSLLGKSKKLAKSDVEIDSSKKISVPNVEELQVLIKQQAQTSEEKYRILDARDKLLRQRQNKRFNLEAKITIGTCPDMCPEKERLLRESQRQVSPYEQLDSPEYGINHATAIKQYSRSSADQEEPMPHDLRPVRSLKMTMSYLLHEIADLCEKPGTNLGEWYHFLWDRTRGIRKDITQQELCCVESVELVEQCARFHIICSERLCAEELSIFDKKINTENLTKCLQSLKYMYHDLRVKGIDCKNEPEFRSYIILLNLNDANFMWDLQKLPSWVQSSPQIKFAIKVYSAIAENNYSRFFKLVRSTTYLNACILLRYFNQVRVKALTVMIKSYSMTTSMPFDLYQFIDILGFEDENDAIRLCQKSGLQIKQTEEVAEILMNRQNFRLPEGNIEQGRCIYVIESKRTRDNVSIGTCISNGKMPPKSYKNHVPHSSFDSEGFLLCESLDARDQIMEQESLLDPYDFIDDEGADSSTSREESPIKPQPEPRFTFLKKPEKKPIPVFQKPLLPVSKPEPIVKSVFPLSKSIFEVGTPVSNSPFSMTVNKSNVFMKFSASVEKPIAKVPEIIPVLKDKSKEEIAEEEKRRKKLEEEKRLLEEEKKKAEVEKMLKEIELKSKKIYESVEESVVREVCAALWNEEMEREKMYITLSGNVYDIWLGQIVDEACEEELRKQLSIARTLENISSRIRNRAIMNYFDVWRRQVRKRKRQRCALEDTPVWLQRETLDECARSMYRPQQEIVIERMCAKKKKLVDEEKYSTPIEAIVYSGLKENHKNLDAETPPRLFWKLAISWPLLEDKVRLELQKKVVTGYLNPEDFTADPILKTLRPNSYEILNLCVRNFEGFGEEDFLVGSDALLFVAAVSEDPKLVEKRLMKTVLSRKKLMPIPLVIIVFEEGEESSRKSWVSPNVENLLDSGYISEFSTIFHDVNDQQRTISKIQSAILWLAINRSPGIPLEMDYLKKVLGDCLMEELWLRIQGHSFYNPQLNHIFEDPNSTINLHNEAVAHLTEIAVDPESLMYTDFPTELKQFLPENSEFPCSFEYFDEAWKRTEDRVSLENCMNQLILPPWRFQWPPVDILSLKNSLFSYCQEVLPETNHSAIASAILGNLFQSFENSAKPSFICILLYVVEEKINLMENDMKVVYNRNHVKHFRSLPWWFKSNTFMNHAKEGPELLEIKDSLMETSDVFEISEIMSDTEEEDIANDSIAILNAFCKEKRDQIKEVLCSSEQLKLQCEKFKNQSVIFEEQMRQALES